MASDASRAYRRGDTGVKAQHIRYSQSAPQGGRWPDGNGRALVGKLSLFFLVDLLALLSLSWLSVAPPFLALMRLILDLVTLNPAHSSRVLRTLSARLGPNLWVMSQISRFCSSNRLREYFSSF